MTQLKPILTHLDSIPSTPGKFKPDKSSPYNLYRLRFHPTLFPRFTLWSFFFIFFIVLLIFFSSPTNPTTGNSRRSLKNSLSPSPPLGPNWERRVRASARPRSKTGFTVLVTGAAGFVGTHVSLGLKRRGDGVLGLDNFNQYYDVGLKKARQGLLERSGIMVVEGDINDAVLLRKLFDAVAFTHVMHMAAQAGVRYAMQNPALDTAKKSTGSGGKKKGAAQLRIYNLGNTKPVPVGRLVSILEKLLKVKAKKKVIQMPRNGDVPFTHANITLAHTELGYKPTTDLEMGLKKFVKWYVSYYGSKKKKSSW
uniref:UDP-D-glucuronate 4-epimerase 5 n=1 Tax=Solanum tuberosum TaxID=4113 RepID=M0ZXH8_SOLTU